MGYHPWDRKESNKTEHSTCRGAGATINQVDSAEESIEEIQCGKQITFKVYHERGRQIKHRVNGVSKMGGLKLKFNPAIPLLGIHTKETRSERDTCTPMFIAALFIIARTWKQPRCPSADKWIRKLWYIYTMDYYSAVKKNSVLMRWMKLEPIIQSEVSQKNKDQYTVY